MLPHDEKKLSLSLVNNDHHLRQNYCEMERDKKLENYIPWVVGRDSFLCFEFRVSWCYGKSASVPLRTSNITIKRSESATGCRQPNRENRKFRKTEESSRTWPQ